MSALLASLRGIGRDLIDKRLWPVAVLLLAALAAVPVLIGGSSGADPAPPGIVAVAEPGAAGAAPPPTASTTGKPATTRSAASNSEGRGAMNDPFFDPPAPPSEAGAGEGGGAGAAGGAGTRAVAKSPTGEAAPRPGTAPETKAPGSAKAKATTPSRKAPTTAPRMTPTPAATAPAPSYLRTVVRVNGATGGKSYPIARLTPLGGATDPAALFLGVAKVGARYAVFVLGPRATSRGQATCKGGTDCRMIGLRAGQTQVVTVRPPNGAIRRFTLRVASIRPVRTSAARARAARARIHADGREVVRDLRRHAASAAALRTARYDSRAGLLRAAGAGAVKNASE